jgi:glycosyltransferase involved in cell wall biosynthesis
MKITHINFGDSARLTGGTATATITLHEALKDLGVDSEVLCRWLDREVTDVSPLPVAEWSRRVESLLKTITQKTGLNDPHAISSFLFKHSDAFKNTDLLHLHCIHQGYFSFMALPYLTAAKPAVYTMHDVWAFTGHCAVNYKCDRWKTGCGKCPYLDLPPAVSRDNTHLEWKLKQWAYQHSNLHIVTPSNWMTKLVQESILGHFPVYQIPHGIDLERYQPLNPDYCRSVFRIPAGKKVLMFVGAVHHYKGADLLAEALNGLPESLKSDVVLLIMGDKGSAIAKATGIEFRHVGNLNSEAMKAIAYSTADLFLFPTRGESFGLVALESLACKTPVVSFNVGGVPDVVRPGETGYLAEPENVEDFRQGILQLLEDDYQRESMGQYGRRIAIEEFSLELEAMRYKAVYERALGLEPTPLPALTPALAPELVTQPSPKSLQEAIPTHPHGHTEGLNR